MSQRTISLYIPGQPIAKGRARVTRRGTFTPQRTRIYERLVATIAAANGLTDPVIDGVKTLLIPPTARGAASQGDQSSSSRAPPRGSGRFSGFAPQAAR